MSIAVGNWSYVVVWLHRRWYGGNADIIVKFLSNWQILGYPDSKDRRIDID